MFDIYDDWTPEQACIKSAQIGFSTMEIVKTHFAAKNKGWNIIYTLPTAGDVHTFVTTKVNKLIDNNPALQEMVKDKDTIFQKQIGNSVIYYRGTTSGRTAEDKTDSSLGIMISADLLVHDESDRSDQVILEQYGSRLDFSQYKGRWFFSNPTVPNIGAHAVFLQSDQKYWFHKCSRCNHRFYLDWETCVDREHGCFMCPKCKGELSQEDRFTGEWIKKYRSRDISGYWINQMMATWKTAPELIAKEATSSKTHFNNFVLGLPYVGSDVVVNRETIVRNIVLTTNDQKDVAIGVDNGIQKHYVIGNKTGIFKVGVTEDWDDIEKMIEVYNATMVIDTLPYPNKVMELQKKYAGRVYGSFYKRDKDDLKTIRWQKGGVVYSDRTKLFEEVIEAFYRGTIKFNISHLELEEYIKHWETLYLSKATDTNGVERTVWESSTGEDHFAHATNLWWIAMTRYGIGDGGSVRPRAGDDNNYSPVIKADNTIDDATTSTDYIFKRQSKKSWEHF